MKQPKLSDVAVDRKGTKKLRSQMAQFKKIKITINIDAGSLNELREISEDTGVPYQRLLNQVLREGLNKREIVESRLDRIERELAGFKRQYKSLSRG